jgi:hypothetical protein
MTAGDEEVQLVPVEAVPRGERAEQRGDGDDRHRHGRETVALGTDRHPRLQLIIREQPRRHRPPPCVPGKRYEP